MPLCMFCCVTGHFLLKTWFDPHLNCVHDAVQMRGHNLYFPAYKTATTPYSSPKYHLIKSTGNIIRNLPPPSPQKEINQGRLFSLSPTNLAKLPLHSSVTLTFTCFNANLTRSFLFLSPKYFSLCKIRKSFLIRRTKIKTLDG